MVEMLTDLGNTGTKPNLKSEKKKKKEKIWELYWLGRFLKKEVIK